MESVEQDKAPSGADEWKGKDAATADPNDKANEWDSNFPSLLMFRPRPNFRRPIGLVVGLVLGALVGLIIGAAQGPTASSLARRLYKLEHAVGMAASERARLIENVKTAYEYALANPKSYKLRGTAAGAFFGSFLGLWTGEITNGSLTWSTKVEDEIWELIGEQFDTGIKVFNIGTLRAQTAGR